MGDDVFGDDPSVKELEIATARMFEKQAAVLCPSGEHTFPAALLPVDTCRIVVDQPWISKLYFGEGLRGCCTFSVQCLNDVYTNQSRTVVFRRVADLTTVVARLVIELDWD